MANQRENSSSPDESRKSPYGNMMSC
jgi:hypothetical protein